MAWPVTKSVMPSIILYDELDLLDGQPSDRCRCDEGIYVSCGQRLPYTDEYWGIKSDRAASKPRDRGQPRCRQCRRWEHFVLDECRKAVIAADVFERKEKTLFGEKIETIPVGDLTETRQYVVSKINERIRNGESVEPSRDLVRNLADDFLSAELIAKNEDDANAMTYIATEWKYNALGNKDIVCEYGMKIGLAKKRKSGLLERVKELRDEVNSEHVEFLAMAFFDRLSDARTLETRIRHRAEHHGYKLTKRKRRNKEAFAIPYRVMYSWLMESDAAFLVKETATRHELAKAIIRWDSQFE